MPDYAHKRSRHQQAVNSGADVVVRRRLSSSLDTTASRPTSVRELDRARVTLNGSARVQSLAQFQRSLDRGPRAARLTQLSALVQREARPLQYDPASGSDPQSARQAQAAVSTRDAAGADERHLLPPSTVVVQRVGSGEGSGDEDDLSDDELDYLPPPRATLWDFIEPVLTPAVKKAEARARALKEEADRLEAEARARKDAEAEARAREEQQRAAEELERARAAAEAKAQAEALAKQQAEQEAEKKANEALQLSTPTPKDKAKSKLGPKVGKAAQPTVVPSARKKRTKGTPLALGVPDVGGYLGRQPITGHPTFVLNLFYTLNNHPGFNQLHVHLDAAGTVRYVSKKFTGQQGNGTQVNAGTALFNSAVMRAAQDR